MRSDVRRHGDRQGHPLAHLGEILDAARSDRSQPGQSVDRIWTIKASLITFDYPQFFTRLQQQIQY